MLKTKIFYFNTYDHNISSLEDVLEYVNNFILSYQIDLKDILEYRTDIGIYEHADYVGNITKYDSYTITLTYWDHAYDEINEFNDNEYDEED